VLLPRVMGLRVVMMMLLMMMMWALKVEVV
jgi:hypothetical protein